MRTYFYYAIHYRDIVVLRKATKPLQRVTWALKNKQGTVVLKQISYTGGLIVGTMSYQEWRTRTGIPIAPLSHKRITRDDVLSVKPFILQGE